MNRKSLYEIIPSLGAVILFFCWVFQQSVVNGLDKRLSSLSAAENTHRVYQSHNAVFNALIATQTDEKVVTAIRRYQTYNYGFGLSQLATQVGIVPLIGYDTTTDEMQSYLERVQAEAARTRQEIERERSTMGFLFVGGYGLGSFLVLLGGILKLKLRPVP